MNGSQAEPVQFAKEPFDDGLSTRQSFLSIQNLLESLKHILKDIGAAGDDVVEGAEPVWLSKQIGGIGSCRKNADLHIDGVLEYDFQGAIRSSLASFIAIEKEYNGIAES